MQVRKIHVTGVVQGVGFRPFVYQLATRAQLCGWVVNTSGGVEMQVEGEPSALDAFVQALADEAPPLARIEAIRVEDLPSDGGLRFEGFEIRASVAQENAFQPISPDISICPDCLRELLDPNDRRYRYPFINCTNCGPRFTIIQDIPYDRPRTTMRAFEMCEDCAREYHDPTDRRFHAQPVACPRCGPQVTLVTTRQRADASGEWEGEPAIQETSRLLAQGSIVAIKGLGGFHLACDATNARAVEELRERKGRVDKPFALMARDAVAVDRFCHVSDEERTLLESRERPIVLLRRRADAPIADLVAPRNDFLGVMLPYTPLHYLLLPEDGPIALVMTSGNLSEEPIAVDNADARERLAGLADYMLLHNRDIETRVDDSVVRVFQGRELPVRRSRGYAPYPVRLPFEARPMLAVGAELKNTFCVTRDQYAFVSQHIGDLENYATLQSFGEQIEHLQHLFRIQPEIVAYDMHPEYLSTRYARELAANGLPAVPVQHHHAHIASCMAENGLADEPVIGVAMDGTGYGVDGKIWGGEFLIARYTDYVRAAHLAYVPLPGGDLGIKRVYRSALAHLAHADVEWDEELPCSAAVPVIECNVIRHQVETGLNAPLTSSMGRLFDAVAAILGVRETINYEAQAAIELEHLVVEDLQGTYAFDFKQEGAHQPVVIDPAPVIREIARDWRDHAPPWVIATRFHNSVAEMICQTAVTLRERQGLERVVLSGGVFQNVTLLARTLARLREVGFQVFIHHLVPPNDGGISLGQAAVAAHRQENRPK